VKVLHCIDPSITPQTSSQKKRASRTKSDPHLQQIEHLLAGVFDHTATLIFDLSLPEVGIQAPLALVNPSGITLFSLDQRRGVFRASATDWEQLDERRKQYRPSHPNPIKTALIHFE
jgi:hypothetical protein